MRCPEHVYCTIYVYKYKFCYKLILSLNELYDETDAIVERSEYNRKQVVSAGLQSVIIAGGRKKPLPQIIYIFIIPVECIYMYVHIGVIRDGMYGDDTVGTSTNYGGQWMHVRSAFEPIYK